MALGYLKLDKILKNLSSIDSNVRRDAEQTFQSLRDEPIELILGLIKELKEHKDSSVRQQAAVFLHFLVDPTKQIIQWTTIPNDLKNKLLAELIQTLDAETVESIRLNVYNTVCALIIEMNGSDDTTHLQLKKLINSANPESQKAGLKVLSNVLPQLDKKALATVYGTISDTLQSCSKSSNFEVRFQCFEVIVSLIDIQHRSYWKDLQNMLPNFIEATLILVNNNVNDLAVGFLTRFIEIVDTAAIFFKPCIHQFVQMLLSIGNNIIIQNDIRQTVMEILIGLTENQPKMCLKLPNFVSQILLLCLKYMSDIKSDVSSNWIKENAFLPISGGEGNNNITIATNYHVGEAAIDRIVAALGGLNTITILYNYVFQYIQKPEWQNKFAGVLAISQTMEYIPRENLEDHLETVVNGVIMQALEHPHYLVRFAACQAIGQISLDCQPTFQNIYASIIIPALINIMNDQSVYVQMHSITALTNFIEETTLHDLRPHADKLIKKLIYYISQQQSILLREQALTCIAIIASILQNEFVDPYYSIVVPPIKEIFQKCVKPNEQKLRGKALESLSIIGLAVGLEPFEKDAHEIIRVMLFITPKIISDDLDYTISNYIHEALCRFCRALGNKFAIYLPHLIPELLQVLHITEDTAEPAAAMTETTAKSHMVTDEASLQQKMDDSNIHVTSKFHKAILYAMLFKRALKLLIAFIEALSYNFGDYLVPTAELIIPLMKCHVSDDHNEDADLKHHIMMTMATILSATRELINNYNNYPTTAGGTKKEDYSRALNKWIMALFEITYKHLNKTEQVDNDLTYNVTITYLNDTQIETKLAIATGFVHCLKCGGADVLLTEEEVHSISTKMFILIQQSQERHLNYTNKPGFYKEDELLDFQTEISLERNYRLALVEIIAALMSLYIKDFTQPTNMLACRTFIETCIKRTINNISSDDSTDIDISENILIALYIITNALEHLKDAGEMLWVPFLHFIVSSLENDSLEVRQAAAYSLSQAIQRKHFSEQLLQQSIVKLKAIIISDLPSKKKDLKVSALENYIQEQNTILKIYSIMALQCILMYRAADLQPFINCLEYLQFLLDYLPITHDNEAARQVHFDFFNLLTQKPSKQSIRETLGENVFMNNYVFKYVLICATIYRTEFSSNDVDDKIRTFIQNVNLDTLQWIKLNLSSQLKRALEKINNDIKSLV